MWTLMSVPEAERAEHKAKCTKRCCGGPDPLKLNDCIGLRKLKNSLVLIEQGRYQALELLYYDEDGNEYFDDNDDGYDYEPFVSLNEYGVFADPEKNNIIVVTTNCIDQEGESLPDDCFSSVVGGITDAPYDYVINALNNNSNTLVYWSQCYGTTSDYRIFYDVVDDFRMNLSDIHRLMDMGDNPQRGKYVETKNKKTTWLDFRK